MTVGTRTGVVIIGIGNIIRSDDGLGVRILERLRARNRLGPEVELVEGGTAGLMLLPHIADARHVIIVDAVNVGAPAGTLIRLADARGVFSTGLTPHDVGLADLLDAARLADVWPEALILHGVQVASTAIGTVLTPSVAVAQDALAAAIEADVSAWDGAGISERGPAPRFQ